MILCQVETVWIFAIRGTYTLIFSFVGVWRLCSWQSGAVSGLLKFADLIEDDTWMMRIMFVAYMVVGNFFLLNLFISVINEGLAYVSENPEEAEFDQAMADYISVSNLSLCMILFDSHIWLMLLSTSNSI